MNIEQIAIADIKISKRIRKEVGDISDLMASIKKLGLLQPIVIDKNRNLIAGYRRLTSFKRLGFNVIDCVIVNRSTKAIRLRAELEENEIRKDFSVSETIDGQQLLTIYENKNIIIRFLLLLWYKIKNLFDFKHYS